FQAEVESDVSTDQDSDSEEYSVTEQRENVVVGETPLVEKQWALHAPFRHLQNNNSLQKTVIANSFTETSSNNRSVELRLYIPDPDRVIVGRNDRHSGYALFPGKELLIIAFEMAKDLMSMFDGNLAVVTLSKQIVAGLRPHQQELVFKALILVF